MADPQLAQITNEVTNGTKEGRTRHRTREERLAGHKSHRKRPSALSETSPSPYPGPGRSPRASSERWLPPHLSSTALWRFWRTSRPDEPKAAGRGTSLSLWDTQLVRPAPQVRAPGSPEPGGSGLAVPPYLWRGREKKGPDRPLEGPEAHRAAVQTFPKCLCFRSASAQEPRVAGVAVAWLNVQSQARAGVSVQLCEPFCSGASSYAGLPGRREARVPVCVCRGHSASP